MEIGCGQGLRRLQFLCEIFHASFVFLFLKYPVRNILVLVCFYRQSQVYDNDENELISISYSYFACLTTDLMITYTLPLCFNSTVVKCLKNFVICNYCYGNFFFSKLQHHVLASILILIKQQILVEVSACLEYCASELRKGNR